MIVKTRKTYHLTKTVTNMEHIKVFVFFHSWCSYINCLQCRTSSVLLFSYHTTINTSDLIIYIIYIWYYTYIIIIYTYLSLSSTQHPCVLVEGTGGVTFIVSDRVEYQLPYQELFRNEKTLYLAKVIAFLNLNIQLHCVRELWSQFPKNQLYNLSYSFWDINLKLGGYVPRTKTKLLIQPIFDLDLRS